MNRQIVIATLLLAIGCSALIISCSDGFKEYETKPFKRAEFQERWEL